MTIADFAQKAGRGTLATSPELLAEAEEREKAMQAKRQQMEDAFHEIAAGRPWYEGTGADDPIMPHQWYGACYGAAVKRWFLGDVPGAGKTRTSVAWATLVGARKIVLVAEANVCNQFAGEFMTLEPTRKIVTLAGLDRDTRHKHLNDMLRSDAAVVVINYEMFRRDREALGKIQMWQPDTVIVDEAHNMKNIKTSNYKYVEQIIFANNMCPECSELIYGVARPCGSCGWKIPQVHADPKVNVKKWLNDSAKDKAKFFSTKSVKNLMELTGTPLLNSPVDLYAIFHLIDPIRFPSEGWFKKTFTHVDYSAKRHVFSRQGLDKLSPLLKGRFLQRTLEEVGIYLPTQRVHIERVELDPKKYSMQARTIEQVSKHAAIMLSSGEKMSLMHVIAIILRKRQANVWPGGIVIRNEEGEVIFDVGSEVQESVKMDACMERLLAYHKQGKRQIVFSQFQTALAEFEKRVSAQGIRAVRFDGSTPGKLRERVKNNFYKAKGEAPEWDVVLVHYKTGGAGLNLTSAQVTHILDEEWNAGRRDQAYARNHRMGQDEETDVHVYRIPGTVDTWMASLISMKEKMVEKLGIAMSGEKQMRSIIDAIKKGEM